MTAPVISRAMFVGTVEKVERKTVNDKPLVEFFLEGLGLRINAWQDQAAKVPAPGSTVVVEGAVKTRHYQNREGDDRQTTEVVASSVEALGSGPAAAPAPAPAVAPTGAILPEGGF